MADAILKDIVISPYGTGVYGVTGAICPICHSERFRTVTFGRKPLSGRGLRPFPAVYRPAVVRFRTHINRQTMHTVRSRTLRANTHMYLCGIAHNSATIGHCASPLMVSVPAQVHVRVRTVRALSHKYVCAFAQCVRYRTHGYVGLFRLGGVPKFITRGAKISRAGKIPRCIKRPTMQV